jgi:hypothetical protein
MRYARIKIIEPNFQLIMILKIFPTKNISTFFSMISIFVLKPIKVTAKAQDTIKNHLEVKNFPPSLYKKISDQKGTLVFREHRIFKTADKTLLQKKKRGPTPQFHS